MWTFQIAHDFRSEAGVLRNNYDIKLEGLFDTQVRPEVVGFTQTFDMKC